MELLLGMIACGLLLLLAAQCRAARRLGGFRALARYNEADTERVLARLNTPAELADETQEVSYAAD